MSFERGTIASGLHIGVDITPVSLRKGRRLWRLARRGTTFLYQGLQAVGALHAVAPLSNASPK